MSIGPGLGVAPRAWPFVHDGVMGYIKSSKNTRSGSTTWVPTVEKMRGSRPRGASRAGGASRWWKLHRRDARDPLTVTIRYRGGNEAWWYVEARGSSGAFPGYRSIHDVMAEINEGSSFRRDPTG